MVLKEEMGRKSENRLCWQLIRFIWYNEVQLLNWFILVLFGDLVQKITYGVEIFLYFRDLSI